MSRALRNAIVLMVVACGGAETKSGDRDPSGESPAPTAAGVVPTSFDGFALGDDFRKIEARAPYEQPCDNDPLEDEPALAAMIYAGRECRRQAFPRGTSVVFLVEHSPGGPSPIRVFGWLGGTYFDDKVKLPVKLGEPLERAIASFGTPTASFDLGATHVDRFAGNVAVFSGRNRQIVGFVFGDMPTDPEAKRWRIFDFMYARYTPPVPSQANTAADCKAALERMLRVHGSLNEGEIADADIAECRANMTPAQIKCTIAAKTKDDMSRCMK